MVSGFHPIITNDRGGDQEVARTLVNDLEHAHAAPRPWGALSSLIAGFLSLGTLPLLLWHDRFRDFVDDEREHLRRFAEWIRLHSSRPETMDLRVAGDDLGTRPLLSALSVLSVVGIVILFATQLRPTAPIVQQVLSYTYEFCTPRAWQWPLSAPQRVFAAWSIGLTVAYLFHWIQVQAHASDVRRFVGYANRIFRASGVPRVPLPRVGMGVAFFWIVAGAILASKGAWWGLALALSGAAQQRYMSMQSPRVRRAIAARVREMARLPVAEDPRRVAGSTRRCPHVRCLAPMPAGARFCPRCGHNLASREPDVS